MEVKMDLNLDLNLIANILQLITLYFIMNTVFNIRDDNKKGNK